MNKENLRAIVFASLRALGFNVKPYCILNNAYDVLYLPKQHTIIPIDLTDDKERRSPNNPVAQNNAAVKDALNVFRIRSIECTPIALASFDYYLDDFDEKSILSLVNYLGTEFGANMTLTALPEQADYIYEQALSEYDNYFKRLCCAYSDATGHTSLRLKEEYQKEHIGVWIDFKGIGFIIKHKGKAIRSRKTSFGSAMHDARAKGQQKANAKLEEQWFANYLKLKQFHAETNDISNIGQTNQKLNGWLRRQRTAHRNNKLSPEHEKLLEELGVDWEPNDKINRAWDEKFNMLLEYEKEHNTIDVPQSEGALGTWVAKQRQLKKKGKLSAEREFRLNEINFIWESPNRRHD